MRFRNVHRAALALCLAVSVGVNPTHGADQVDDEVALIRAVVEGYQNNRESFRFLTCRFTVTYGQVRSVEDALAGRWNESDERILRRRGSWIYDGDKMCYMADSNEPPVLGPAHEEGEEEAVGIRSGGSWHWLTDGSIRFRHAVGSSLSNLIGPDEVVSNWGPAVTPFSLGMMGESERANPYAVITKGLNEGLCRYEGEKDVLGRKTLTISAGPHTFFRRHYFDPDRGYLAIRIDYSWDPKNPQASSRGWVTHTRECSNGRWFPMRCVRVLDPDAPTGVLRDCRIIETVELDEDHPPPQESFALDLPKDLRVSTRSGGMPSRLRLQTPMRLDLTNLDDLLRAVVAQANTGHGFGDAPKSTAFATFVWIATVVMALVAFALLARRKGYLSQRFNE